MKLRNLALSILVALALAACGGNGDDAPSATSTPTPEPTPEVTPTPEGDVATGEVARGKSLRSRDGMLQVSGTGSLALDVTISPYEGEKPAVPDGWKLVSEVYEVRAADSSGRELSTLEEPLTLRFEIEHRLGAVAYADGTSWDLLPTELEDGQAVAETGHLSQFAVIAPATTFERAPAATPTATPTDDTATETLTPAATETPISAEVIEASLAEAARRFRTDRVSVSGATLYDGSGGLELPLPLTDALTEVGRRSAIYAGVYGGVNQLLTAEWKDAGSRFALFIEPKLTFPATTRQAQTLLAEYFPGAAGQRFAPIAQTATMYTYQAINSDGFVVLGFVQHEGVPIAFMAQGNGIFAPAVTETSE